jgi:hypothetical protein
LDFLEAHHGIVNLNKTLSQNVFIIPTKLSIEQDPLANHIWKVTLPSIQVILPNTISNVPFTLERNLTEDDLIKHVQDSRGLLGSNILGSGKQAFVQLINYSNKCVKLQ